MYFYIYIYLCLIWDNHEFKIGSEATDEKGFWSVHEIRRRFYVLRTSFDPVRHCGLNTLGGSPVMDPPRRLHLLHRLLPARRRAPTSTVLAGRLALAMTPSHLMKKLSVPLPPKFTYLFTFAIPKYSGATSLPHYSKYTRYSWLCHYFVTTNIFSYLVNLFSLVLDISSPAQCNYFLQFSEIIFFGSVELFYST
jgi:hypothetical protein